MNPNSKVLRKNIEEFHNLIPDSIIRLAWMYEIIILPSKPHKTEEGLNGLLSFYYLS